MGEVVSEVEQSAEELEIIGKIHFFTISEIMVLHQKGEFVDGRTMSALFLYQNTHTKAQNTHTKSSAPIHGGKSITF